MRSFNPIHLALISLLGTLTACTVNVTAPASESATAVATTATSAAAPARAPESAALQEARKKVRDINWSIGQAESELRQLSPPIRITDSKGTTYDVDKQRQYEINRARVDRKIRELKEERTVWELRVNSLVLAEDALNRSSK